MQIIIVDTSNGSATPAAPSIHIIDTTSGLVQFISGGVSTPGTIVFNQNGTPVFTPPSNAVWAYLQTQVTLGLMNGVQQLNFANYPLMTITAPAAFPIAGGVMTINGTGFQSGCTCSADISSGSAIAVTNLGTASFINSTALQINFPATSAGTYVLTVFNPNGNYATIAVTTS